MSQTRETDEQETSLLITKEATNCNSQTLCPSGQNAWIYIVTIIGIIILAIFVFIIARLWLRRAAANQAARAVYPERGYSGSIQNYPGSPFATTTGVYSTPNIGPLTNSYGAPNQVYAITR